MEIFILLKEIIKIPIMKAKSSKTKNNNNNIAKYLKKNKNNNNNYQQLNCLNIILIKIFYQE